MRRLVVAPDKFKGALDAAAVAAALSRGFVQGFGEQIEVRAVPMADGGEGTVDAFVAAGAQRVTRRVRGPLGDPVEAAFALDGTTAIVEMAAASGLELVPHARRDPLRASTYGTGELIRGALDGGARRIVVGIGGSATNDGGAGMLQALGARFLDPNGDELAPGGAALARLEHVDLSALDLGLHEAHIEVASDVDNPLCGPSGASVVFGPQKGASPDDVATLDKALAHFADMTASETGADHRNDPGAGAAGGLGFGLIAYLRATLRPGVEIVAELRGLNEA
ncbi:MAG: glycerate kinase, partial [Candidatus Baltobacteraceae bacterium]